MTERLCSRCGISATHKQGCQWLCTKHYRFTQMRNNARKWNKSVPSWDELENMVNLRKLRCDYCNRKMNWLSKDGYCSVLSLQHYRDGTCGFMCRSCNSRHHNMPEDTFCDTPMEHKYCPRCKVVKPFTDYYKDNSRGGETRLKSWCKNCIRKPSIVPTEANNVP